MENVFFTICTMLFIAASVSLVLVILVQKPQGGGLSAAFGAGGGASQTAFGAKTGDMLTLGTVGVFIFFLAISITLVLMSGARYGGTSGVPDAPEDLTAVATSANSVQLTWSDESDTEEQYDISRTQIAEPVEEDWNLIWSTARDVEVFDDSTVLPGTTYFYRVSASNITGASDPTEMAEATTPDAEPETTPIDPLVDPLADPLTNPVIGGEGDDTPDQPTASEENNGEESQPDPDPEQTNNEDDGG